MPSGSDRRRPRRRRQGIATINKSNRPEIETHTHTDVCEETILPDSGEANEMVNCKDVPDTEMVVGAGECSLHLLPVPAKTSLLSN